MYRVEWLNDGDTCIKSGFKTSEEAHEWIRKHHFKKFAFPMVFYDGEQKYGFHMIKKGKVNIMAGHIIDKDNTTKALQSVNRLLSQSLEVIKKVNEDEQWDFCTDDRLAHIVNDTERLTKEISKIVYKKK